MRRSARAGTATPRHDQSARIADVECFMIFMGLSGEKAPPSVIFDPIATPSTGVARANSVGMHRFCVRMVVASTSAIRHRFGGRASRRTVILAPVTLTPRKPLRGQSHGGANTHVKDNRRIPLRTPDRQLGACPADRRCFLYPDGKPQ